ncbi:MAG: nucleotidyl transferase AbiEii/AbiGii toxin family protein [bacterium]|nr:nucleotidyl transferase AbiEii/AbiGii toxin family protein [bacterium]
MNNFILEMQNIVKDGKKQGLENDLICNILKEYLHYFVLDYIYGSKFKDMVFYGGSALRMLFDLPRLSEDIDFEADERIDLRELAVGLENYFKKDLALYEKIQVNKMRTINRIFLKLPVLYEIGLSPHKGEVLRLKVEARPLPVEFFNNTKTSLTLKSKYGVTFVAKHYDLPTLFATKLPAILGRKGINFKGRDFYDLIWYMEQGIIPDPIMLEKKEIKKPLKEIFDDIENFVASNKSFSRGLSADLRPLFASSGFVDAFSKNFLEVFQTARKKYNL